MFEETEEKKATSGNKVGMAVALVAALVVAAILFFTMSSGPGKGTAQGTSAAEAAKTPPDPIHDLKVLRATMDKDPSGTTALWVLAIENKSKIYTYSEIQYETTYLGADSKPVLVNKSTITANVDPGEQYRSELRDTLYPAGTVLYQFKVTGAKATAQ